MGHAKIFELWRADNDPPTADEVHRDVLTDFDSMVGVVGHFVSDSHFMSGVLKVAHGFRRVAGLPGQPSPSRRETFACVGGAVEGPDVETFRGNK